MLKIGNRTTEAPHKAGIVQNSFLATLRPHDFDRLRPYLRTVELKRHAIIHEANKPVDAVYFVESGVISRVARTQADGPVEVAMVGRFGFVGLSVVLGTMIALHRTVVQVPGIALRIAASDMQSVMYEHPSIRDHLLRYVQELMTQKAQVSLCNARHSIDQRLARWLLLAHDRVVGGELPVTHDLLSMMLGVRRAGVSDAVGRLEAEGILSKQRGSIRITDREKLRGKACECYKIIDDRSFWQRAMPQHRHVLNADT